MLGNIASKAVVAGLGEGALPILRFIQEIRPENAGAFLMEAMHLSGAEGAEVALRYLEDSPVFSAETNRDEAIAFHLVLVQECGNSTYALELGETYLAEKLLVSESAIQLVERLVDDLRATQPRMAARL
ncbi:MAG: hypothetical protein ACRC14_08155 [Paracoccaceae bacterium]